MRVWISPFGAFLFCLLCSGIFAGVTRASTLDDTGHGESLLPEDANVSVDSAEVDEESQAGAHVAVAPPPCPTSALARYWGQVRNDPGPYVAGGLVLVGGGLYVMGQRFGEVHNEIPLPWALSSACAAGIKKLFYPLVCVLTCRFSCLAAADHPLGNWLGMHAYAKMHKAVAALIGVIAALHAVNSLWPSYELWNSRQKKTGWLMFGSGGVLAGSYYALQTRMMRGLGYNGFIVLHVLAYAASGICLAIHVPDDHLVGWVVVPALLIAADRSFERWKRHHKTLVTAEYTAGNKLCAELKRPEAWPQRWDLAKHDPGQFAYVGVEGRQIPLTLADYNAETDSFLVVIAQSGAATRKAYARVRGEEEQGILASLPRPTTLTGPYSSRLQRLQVRRHQVSITSGAGMTPAMALIEKLAEHRSSEPVSLFVVHCDRAAADVEPLVSALKKYHGKFDLQGVYFFLSSYEKSVVGDADADADEAAQVDDDLINLAPKLSALLAPGTGSAGWYPRHLQARDFAPTSDLGKLLPRGRSNTTQVLLSGNNGLTSLATNAYCIPAKLKYVREDQ